MATNGARASSVASSTTGSFVDASGFKFSKDEQKAGKVKLKKPTKKKSEVKNENVSTRSPSPILPDMDDATHAAFPDGKPRETALETIICKHCKRPVLKKNSKEHIAACLKSKQEKARKKKEAREAAAKAKEKAERGDDEDAKGVPDDDSEIKVEPAKPNGARKSAVKATKDDDKKGKKRKAGGDDDESKEPKKKKKKEEPKPKAPKPKGPVDVEKQCGVTLPNGAQCARSLTCKTHSMGAKRAVPGRSLPYDMLLQAYQKKNQARQQKAAIDANAGGNLSDSEILDPTLGAVDSDEERDNVMTALRRSLANPQPIAQHVIFPQRKKYQLVRMKEILGNAMVGNRAGVGLFSVVVDGGRDSMFAVPSMNGVNGTMHGQADGASNGASNTPTTNGTATATNGDSNTASTPAPGQPTRKPSGASGQPKARKPSTASSTAAQDYSFHDPPLTELGEKQCRELHENLQQTLPLAQEIELIISSPMVRTLQTSLIGLDWLIQKGVKLEVNALWQENSAKPCDTGSPVETLKEKFPALDFSTVDPVFPCKDIGTPYAFTRDTVLGRGESALRDLYNRKEKVIAVVSHSGFLRVAVSYAKYFNADYRIFTFAERPSPDAIPELIESPLTEVPGGGMGRSEKGRADHVARDFPGPEREAEEAEYERRIELMNSAKAKESSLGEVVPEVPPQ